MFKTCFSNRMFWHTASWKSRRPLCQTQQNCSTSFFFFFFLSCNNIVAPPSSTRDFEWPKLPFPVVPFPNCPAITHFSTCPRYKLGFVPAKWPTSHWPFCERQTLPSQKRLGGWTFAQAFKTPCDLGMRLRPAALVRLSIHVFELSCS